MRPERSQCVIAAGWSGRRARSANIALASVKSSSGMVEAGYWKDGAKCGGDVGKAAPPKKGGMTSIGLAVAPQ
jgi:hypothetical protein